MSLENVLKGNSSCLRCTGLGSESRQSATWVEELGSLVQGVKGVAHWGGTDGLSSVLGTYEKVGGDNSKNCSLSFTCAPMAPAYWHVAHIIHIIHMHATHTHTIIYII